MNASPNQCRSCGSHELKEILDLGSMPLADGLVKEEDFGKTEPRYPLEVVFCPSCSLVQILETVPPEKLFCEDYPYFSSFSDALLEHSRKNVEAIIADRGLDSGNLAIELASNDGYLLQYYQKQGIPVLGIDPADGPARAAQAKGIETLETFFTLDLARKLAQEGKRADVLHGNNVLAHVADTNGFVEGIATILADDGVAVIEVPYLRDLVDHCEFDTIYHEHLCYFSVTALSKLFGRHGLHLNRVQRLGIHGGSLRLFVEKHEAREASVLDLLQEEEDLGMTRLPYYEDFAGRVEGIREELRGLLLDLKASGKTIAAYGAAAKGATLLNYTDIDHEVLDFVVDRNVHKQGRRMPGVQLQILPPEQLLEAQPDYTLILPWNFAEEIQKQQAEYVRRGGRFILPIPRPRVLEAN